MTISKISLHINGFEAGDKGLLIDKLVQLSPTTVLVMDDQDLAILIATKLPETKVVYRKYFDLGNSLHEGTEYQWKTPKTWVSEATRWGFPNIWRHVANEPTWNSPEELQKLVRWLEEVSQELEKQGYAGVLGNFSTGATTQTAIEAGAFDPIIRVAANSPRTYIGVHEYTGGLLPLGVGKWHPMLIVTNPELIQPNSWPKMSELPTARVDFMGTKVLPGYWDLRRSDWLTIRARELGLKTDPKLWISEGGWDTLSDEGKKGLYDGIARYYGVSRPPNGGQYPGIRGHQTLRMYWNIVFPQWANEPGRAEFEQLKWWSSILPENVVGVNLFAWNYNSLWSGNGSAGMNFAETPEVIDLLIAETKREQPPTEPSVPPTLPVPTKSSWTEPTLLKLADSFEAMAKLIKEGAKDVRG